MKKTSIICLFSIIAFTGCQSTSDFVKDTFYEKKVDESGKVTYPANDNVKAVQKISESLPVPFLPEVIGLLVSAGSAYFGGKFMGRKVGAKPYHLVIDSIKDDMTTAEKEKLLQDLQKRFKSANMNKQYEQVKDRLS